ncbi:MAG TPA: PP2C family serine/threonine-protein phosphatase [Rhodanobacteraceae bacterium]|nr:PP2C family serine/threonine-protein phosphatase [Rhodanobacteraceae bacterium]
MARHFRAAGRTEIGKVRRRNEDAILVRDDAGLWAVADGLGGHADGDVASGLIVERLGALPRRGGVLDFVESIEDALAGVNRDLRQMALARGVDLIASTVALLVHGPDFMLSGWVGDSRCYCCEAGRLAQLTRDHLYGMDDRAEQWGGGVEQSQPGGGVLTRAVGADDALYVDWVVAGRRPGLQFVLCTDGLNKEVSDAEIEDACRRQAAPDAVLADVFRTSLGREARDNISAVVVRLQD